MSPMIRGRHGLVGHRSVRRRDSHAEPGRGGQKRRAVHAVLQHGALQPDARKSAHRHYPHQAGMGYLDNLIRRDSLGFQGKLGDRSVTMAEVLKASGYFTAMSGK